MMGLKPPKLTYDPKLREAIAEIKAVLKKHDIVGLVSLHSKTHGEFAFEPHASWSLCELIPGPTHEATMRFKMRPKQKEDLEATTAFIYNTRDFLRMWWGHFEQMCNMIQKHALVLHNPIDGRISNDDRKPGGSDG